MKCLMEKIVVEYTGVILSNLVFEIVLCYFHEFKKQTPFSNWKYANPFLSFIICQSVQNLLFLDFHSQYCLENGNFYLIAKPMLITCLVFLMI